MSYYWVSDKNQYSGHFLIKFNFLFCRTFKNHDLGMVSGISDHLASVEYTCRELLSDTQKRKEKGFEKLHHVHTPTLLLDKYLGCLQHDDASVLSGGRLEGRVSEF